VPGVAEVGMEMMAVAAAVAAVPAEGKAEHDEDDAQDALTPHPSFLGHALVPPK